MTITATDAAAAIGRRESAGTALAATSDDVAAVCHEMAKRFHGGGTLLVFGNGSSATDAAHIAVEFVHPVIVGKRALPAMSLTNDAATLTGVAQADGFDDTFVAQLRLQARPGDIALGLSADGQCRNVQLAMDYAHQLGLLTVAMVGRDGGALADSPSVEYVLQAQSHDPLVIKEIQVTTYHVLWELVHVFFEQPGLLSPEVIR